jgi:hypothetical protein
MEPTPTPRELAEQWTGAHCEHCGGTKTPTITLHFAGCDMRHDGRVVA